MTRPEPQIADTQVIYIDGKRYIRVDLAAAEFDRTREYLMTQCRRGKIEGRRVGRVWYIKARAALDRPLWIIGYAFPNTRAILG